MNTEEAIRKVIREKLSILSKEELMELLELLKKVKAKKAKTSS